MAPFNESGETVKHAVDMMSIGVVVASVANILPSIASALTIIWMAIRIWESETCKRLTGRKD